jgi:protein ImuB
MKRIVSVWLPFLATDRLCRGVARQQDNGQPLATATTGGVRRLLAVNPAARSAGLRSGMVVADAQAILPDLRLVAADPLAERALLDHLADWCLCYTPWSAADDWRESPGDGGGLWLDISGCAHLWGGEEALLGDLLSRLRRQGFSARAAVADTPGAAWAWARFGDAEKPCLPSGGQRQILAGLPVPALRLLPATVAGLARLGLKVIGDLDALPRAGLTARFGPAITHRLDQAFGRQSEPIVPRQPPVAHRLHRAFAEPIGRTSDVAAAIRQMLARLCADLEAQRLGLRRLEVTAFRLDASAQHLLVGTSRPCRDPRHLFRLLSEPLERFDAGFGIEMLRLSAFEVAMLAAKQSTLDGAPAAEEGEALVQMLDRLGNRLGFDRVHRFAMHPSHLPERAVRRLAPNAVATEDAWPADRRPLRLLARPETVEAVAPLPDAPPLLFRWRRQIHRIAHAEGPERLSAEWWREQQPDRDYYRVEDEAGRRFWLYREGAYGGAVAPRWYLHGIFP